MTEFGSLYYTDCRPGQGLLGGAGFQFQATSVGVAPDVRELVQRTVLYEPPSVWMRERRPVGQYPRSLAHVVDGRRYVTAVGSYLGTEMNGMREGNQFTHAIVTEDPASYGLARPAQLWGATWWAGEPAPTTVCEPVPAEPPPGPWHAQAVRDRIAENPKAENWMIALLSALHGLSEPDRVRILIVSDDAETAAVWIAAATLLLPRKDALGIGFKVYATNPHYSPHEILVVHPDWAGPLMTSSGFAVFDLTQDRHASIVPTERAKFWVSRFLQCDPYDVVDAVEFAGASGRAGALSRPESDADRRAAAVVALGERSTTTAHATLLADWLGAAPPDAAQLSAEAVVEAVLAGTHDALSLRRLDAAVHGRGIPALASVVRRALAEAEVAAAYRMPDGRGPDHAVLAPAEGSQADHATIVGVIERGLGSARPEQLPSLLALASRFHVAPRIATFLDTAHAFVVWWADHPDAAVELNRWSSGAELIDLLRDELTQRLHDSRRHDTERDIHSHWWRFLWDTVMDPAHALDAALIDAGSGQADAAARQKAQLAALRQDRPDPGVFAWRVVFGERRPDPAAVLHFLRVIPSGAVSNELADRAYRIMDAAPKPSLDVLEVLRVLRPTWASPPGCRHVAAWVEEDAALSRVMSALDRLSTGIAAWENGRQLRRISPELLAARLGALVDALLRGEPAISELVVLSVGASVRRVLIPELERRWKQPGTIPEIGSPDGNRAAAMAFLLTGRRELGDDEVNDLSKRLAAAVPNMAKRQRGNIARLLPVADQKEWLTWAAKKTPYSRGGVWTRRATPTASKKRGNASADETDNAGDGSWWRSGRRR